MKISREVSKNNYKQFVEEVYQLTHARPTRVSMNGLCKKHHISTMMCTTLQERGLLKRGKLNTYRWVGPAPHDQMVNELRDSVLAYHNRMWKASVKDSAQLELAPETKPHIDKVPTMKAKTKKTRVFSFLWGAIKFNY
jgi:hypothetical protein